MDNENKSEKDEEGILKSKYYFDLKGATNEVSSAFGARGCKPETAESLSYCN